MTRLAMALVWFFALGGLGAFFPFYTLYLYENAGLSGTQVGWVMAMLPLVGIAAQPFWGNLADRSGLRGRVLAILAIGAAAGYAALYAAVGFSQLLLLTALLAAFSAALIPTAVSVTFALFRNPREFGLSRVWGTVGFLVMVVCFPRALDSVQRLLDLEASPGGPSEPGLELMFPITGACVLVSGLLALALPREGDLGLRAPRGDWLRLMRHPPFVRFLLFAFGAYLFLQGPMALFPVFVRAHGGSIHSVSDMWLPMLLLEIPLIAFAGASLERVGPRGLLAIGVLAGGVRWTVCGLVDDLRWIHLVQILHGVVVAGLVIGGPLYVEAVAPERLRSTGQGLLAMVGVSLGGISSNLAAGRLLDRLGADAPYALGGIGALMLCCALPWLVPRPMRPRDTE